MKLLNGFGKKYFTLCSIQAYAVAPKLHSVITSYKSHLSTKLSLSCENDNEEEESPPLLQESLLSCFYLYFGKIDIVVSSRGTVIPMGEIKTLQPIEFQSFTKQALVSTW